ARYATLPFRSAFAPHSRLPPSSAPSSAPLSLLLEKEESLANEAIRGNLVSARWLHGTPDRTRGGTAGRTREERACSGRFRALTRAAQGRTTNPRTASYSTRSPQRSPSIGIRSSSPWYMREKL